MLTSKISHNPFRKFSKRVAKKLRKIGFNHRYRWFENLGLDHYFPKASTDWFIHREIVYGGVKRNIPIRRTSPLDPRSEAEIQSDRMRGGDRMLFHGYAREYSKYLYSLDHDSRLVVAEFGILNGSGLAIWCDLFPNARILGFDIDISYFEENRGNLQEKGAFSLNSPEIYTYDQFVENQELLQEILNDDTIDICIDDGCHFDEAIICTMRSVMPNLSDRFIYFIEDNGDVHKQIVSLYPDINLYSREQMTVVHRGI